jgi:hypothetical protein
MKHRKWRVFRVVLYCVHTCDVILRTYMWRYMLRGYKWWDCWMKYCFLVIVKGTWFWENELFTWETYCSFHNKQWILLVLWSKPYLQFLLYRRWRLFVWESHYSTEQPPPRCREHNKLAKICVVKGMKIGHTVLSVENGVFSLFGTCFNHEELIFLEHILSKNDLQTILNIFGGRARPRPFFPNFVRTCFRPLSLVWWKLVVDTSHYQHFV